MSAKEVVKAFYDLDLAKDENVLEHFHNDCVLKWHSSKGYSEFDLDGVKNMLEAVKQSYHSFKYRLSHLLEEGNTVTARYTVYSTTIERPQKEDALAHFISIWVVKDGLLHSGYEISQLADDSSDSLNSYAEINI